MCPTALVLSSVYTDPTGLHIYKKYQYTVIFIYHTTAKYIPAIIMPLKYHKYGTCPNSVTCSYGGRMIIYIPHMRLISLTM